jgi:death-on-curing protein
VRYEAVRYLEVDDVIDIHADALERYGGSDGILDPGKLDSAVTGPKATFDGVPLLASMADVASAYIYYLTKLHPFVDGNKRTALLSAAAFLGINGIAFPFEAQHWPDVVVRVAESKAVTREDLAVMIAKGLGDWVPISLASPTQD